ncbi:helix-turn-helix transcriptional regulator [Actinoplanes sp. NPDC026623]|uniref:helix-turn-helix domain-containing protein n=1 Tax=Actinoplanes sp. NPDC026623 TaxID=3155610 RepID=UPI00340C243F
MIPARPDSAAGPTALRIRLGAQLRRLRQARGIGRDTAGWEIRGSGSKISRMELGRVPFKERDIEDLLTLYGVADDERVALMALARRANAAPWWQRFGEVVPPWFLSYLGLEEAATRIRTYETQFVPGLLQTEEYARALIARSCSGASPSEIDRRVEVRRGRRQVLDRPDPPHFWAVLDEAVLRRPIGGCEVMRAQLEALLEAAGRPGVRLQVVPFDGGTPSAPGFPFTILRFAEPELPDVVYVEQLTGATYLDRPGDVDHYALAMERACVEAEPPERTADILARVLADAASRSR